MERRLLDPEAERFLLAALAYLDDVRTADVDYWPGVLEALYSVAQGLGRGDPRSAHAGVAKLERVLQTRAIPIGSRPAEPMPESVRELNTTIRHRLGAAPAAGSAPGTPSSGAVAADGRRPGRDRG